MKQLKHENGRPTKADQVTIQRDLRYYFERSISATLTAKKTGYNIKTVLKYFEKWNKEILQSENPDFLKRCKEEKSRTVLTIEKELVELYDDEKEIKLLIQVAKKSGDLKILERFYKLKLDIRDRICKLVSDRINLVNALPADTLFDLQKGETK